ncbi:MAG: response regulator [Chloroflexota bacterium]|nr:response regulator [Chloroflexota bacterium]
MAAILIIEDEINIRLFVMANLEARGYSVFEAGTGEEGLHLLRSVQPDVLIMDMVLPDMTGEDILSHMAQDGQISKIPTIVMSGSPTPDGESQFANVVQRVVKPASITTLIDAVQTAL